MRTAAPARVTDFRARVVAVAGDLRLELVDRPLHPLDRGGRARAWGWRLLDARHAVGDGPGGAAAVLDAQPDGISERRALEAGLRAFRRALEWDDRPAGRGVRAARAG